MDGLKGEEGLVVQLDELVADRARRRPQPKARGTGMEIGVRGWGALVGHRVGGEGVRSCGAGV